MGQTVTCYGQGDTFVWTNGGIDSRWRNEDNWANTTSSIDAFPSFEDTAIFLSDTSIAGGGSIAANIEIREGVRVLVNQSSISVNETFNNQGELTFLEDNIENTLGNGLDLSLSFASDDGVTLIGGGTIRLNGSETGIIGSGSLGALITNLNNTIRGNGELVSLSLLNQASIIAEGDSLRINQSSISSDLDGQIFVTADSNLNINRSVISGDGELFGEVGATITGSNSNTLEDLLIRGSFVLGSEDSDFRVLLGGTITNQAQLTFAEDNVEDVVSDGLDQEFVVGSDVLLTGGGTLRLNGSETGIRSNGVARLTNGNHTIRGDGELLRLILENNGSVVVEGGSLLLNSSSISGDGQVTVASDGLITTNSAEISEGTLLGQSGSILQGTHTLRDLTIAGDLTLGIESTLTTSSFEGTITNQGELAFVEDDVDDSTFSVANQRITFDSNVILNGAGTLRLNGSQTGIQGIGDVTLINEDNTIRGRGELRRFTLGNEGEVIAEGGELLLCSAFIENENNGRVVVAQDGGIVGTNIILSGISGGTLVGEAGGSLSGDHALRDLTIEGNFTLGTESTSTTSNLQGTITNRGELTFVEDTTDDFGLLDQSFFIDSDVTLNGGGTVRLAGSETGFRGANGAVLTNVDNTIRGNGEFINLSLVNQGSIIAEGGELNIRGGSVNNSGILSAINSSLLAVFGLTENSGQIIVGADSEIVFGELVIDSFASVSGGGAISSSNEVISQGTISPGGSGSPNVLTFGSDLTFAPTSLLQIELGPTANDQLVVNGDLTLDGTLSIALLEDFTPEESDIFTLVSANVIEGNFLNIENGQRLFTSDQSGSFVVNIESSAITLSSFQLTMKGDVNLDGEINFSDIEPFISVLISGEFRRGADCNCDGVVDFADIPVFITILLEQ